MDKISITSFKGLIKIHLAFIKLSNVYQLTTGFRGMHSHLFHISCEFTS